jgi:hypothetical protein
VTLRRFGPPFFLNRDRASHGIDGARELDQYTVAGGLDDAAPMGSDCRINDLAPMRFQSCERADFISTHQARVAGDIGCENGCKAAFELRLGHLGRSNPG